MTTNDGPISGTVHAATAAGGISIEGDLIVELHALIQFDRFDDDIPAPMMFRFSHRQAQALVDALTTVLDASAELAALDPTERIGHLLAKQLTPGDTR